MLKSIRNILPVTLRDVITYKTCLNSNLKISSQPSVQHTFVLGSESSLPGEEPARPAQRRLPQWQTNRCLLLPAWSSPVSACLPVPCICLTSTDAFSLDMAVSYWSLTHCLSLVFLPIHLFIHNILCASIKASKSLFLVTTGPWGLIV